MKNMKLKVMIIASVLVFTGMCNFAFADGCVWTLTGQPGYAIYIDGKYAGTTSTGGKDPNVFQCNSGLFLKAPLGRHKYKILAPNGQTVAEYSLSMEEGKTYMRYYGCNNPMSMYNQDSKCR